MLGTVLVGVASSLVALPAFESDTLPAERAEWQRLRAEHMTRIRETFASLQPTQRVLLFCHDPTALPFLSEEPAIRARLPQIERTIIGHLHSRLILWKAPTVDVEIFRVVTCNRLHLASQTAHPPNPLTVSNRVG